MRSKLPTHLPPVLHQLHTQWRRIEQKLSKLFVMMKMSYSVGHWQVWIWMRRTKKVTETHNSAMANNHIS